MAKRKLSLETRTERQTPAGCVLAKIRNHTPPCGLPYWNAIHTLSEGNVRNNIYLL